MAVPLNQLGRMDEDLRRDLVAASARVIDSGWWVLGREHDAFEKAWATTCGAGHAIGVANGTDALELMLRALEIGPGDEVITVANAGFYTSTACLAVGATPVYVDIDAATQLMDPSKLAALLSEKTKAVVATHLYGRACDMEGLGTALGDHPAVLLEDGAQAHGVKTTAGCVGSLGRMASFSFYPTKNLGAIGDGGAITTSDDALASRLRELRQYGWTAKYTCSRPGRNSRLDELQAAFLSAKLPHLEAANERRRAIATRYGAEIGAPVEHPPLTGENFVAHLYVVQVAARDAWLEALRAKGIGAAVHYPIADHRQPCLENCEWRAGDLTETESAIGRILTLPCFPEMTDEEVGDVIAAVNQTAAELTARV